MPLRKFIQRKFSIINKAEKKWKKAVKEKGFHELEHKKFLYAKKFIVQRIYLHESSDRLKRELEKTKPHSVKHSQIKKVIEEKYHELRAIDNKVEGFAKSVLRPLGFYDEFFKAKMERLHREKKNNIKNH
ncbi:MAG: hypothetical protein AB1467_05240 [Candidatus Diapherotrites archaeon]